MVLTTHMVLIDYRANGITNAQKEVITKKLKCHEGKIEST